MRLSKFLKLRFLAAGGRALGHREATLAGERANLSAAEGLLRPTREFDSAVRGLGLLASGLQWLPPVREEDQDANVLATMACLTMAHRNLSAALGLTLQGYFGEARCLLRLSYEASGQARMFAKEPVDADRWLRQGKTWSEKEVKRWLRSARGLDDETAGELGRMYGTMSAWAHPVNAG